MRMQSPKEPPTQPPAAWQFARSLRGFSGEGYDKGRGVLWQALWFAVQNTIFGAWWCPPWLRPVILRAFGAQVGARVFLRHRVQVLWPWKLTVGDDCWIAEDVVLLSLEPITIGHGVCLSQAVCLCTGSHDRRSSTFAYDNAAITIEDGAWIAARATVLRGVTVGVGAVVPVASVVARNVPACVSAWMDQR